jgi:hypothetical protein
LCIGGSCEKRDTNLTDGRIQGDQMSLGKNRLNCGPTHFCQNYVMQNLTVEKSGTISFSTSAISPKLTKDSNRRRAGAKIHPIWSP